MDCGGSFPGCAMDFDHRPGEIKLFTIARAVAESQSRGAIEAEISKCDIVCSNCHRIRTFNRLGVDESV